MSPTRVSSRERCTATALLGIAFLLRIPYAFHYRFNSDEPQHLHVIWGWTQGLLQYRDLFDNHPPIFHLAMAPVLALVGERPEALPVMRLAMLPLWLAALALTFTIAGRLYSERVALWATVLLAVHFEFYFTSLEFRSDDLWTVAWLAALAVLVSGALTTRRALATGLILGGALGVSQKTLLVAASLAGAVVLTLVLAPEARARLPLRRAVVLAGVGLAGLLVVPVLLLAGFAAAGALAPMLYCTVQHNLLAGMGGWGNPWRILLFPVGLAAAILVIAPMFRAAGGEKVRALRLVLLLAAVVYFLAVQSLWPLVTGQDWLPLYPLVAMILVGGIAAWAANRDSVLRSRRTSRLAAGVLAALLFAELGVLVFRGPVWRDRAAPEIALVAAVLRLTGPADRVMDAKGETVFRRRPFYWILEGITRERLHRGLIRDSIPEDLVASGCRVATLDDARFPERARRFLAENYVPVGPVRVVGKVLQTGDERRPVGFTVAVPAEYTVVTERGLANGSLDGEPFTGSRRLGAGRHEFSPDAPTGPLAVVWAQAVARGFSPFAVAEAAL